MLIYPIYGRTSPADLLSVSNRKTRICDLRHRIKLDSSARKNGSAQCKRIVGGRKLLVYVLLYKVTAIFDFMTEEN